MRQERILWDLSGQQRSCNVFGGRFRAYRVCESYACALAAALSRGSPMWICLSSGDFGREQQEPIQVKGRKKSTSASASTPPGVCFF